MGIWGDGREVAKDIAMVGSRESGRGGEMGMRVARLH